VRGTYVTLRGGMASLERRVAIDAARAAGQLLTRELPASRRIAYKGGVTNLVTEMDARAEELIVGRLSATFPDDGILAEERGAIAGRSGWRWIIDPLDGTTNLRARASGLRSVYCAPVRSARRARRDL
jgi:fructose-1,6-bisphosphatase/inositol monophosphatase family enzyme